MSDRNMLFSPNEWRQTPEIRSYEPPWHDRVVNYLTNAVYGENANAQQRERVNLLAGPENPLNIPAQVNQGYNTLSQGVALRDPTQAGVGALQMAMSLPFGIGKAPAQAATKGIKAYHGSPHDFDHFSLDKIGTGEGAQSYGHGLYFAENEGVARQYRRELSRDNPQAFDNPERAKLSNEVASELTRMGKSPLSGDLPDHIKQKMDAIGKMEGRGRMYEVNIKADPNDFLDWDKPLSQQSEKVRALENYPHVSEYMKARRDAVFPRKVDDTGEMVVRAFGAANGENGASKALREAGIPGIKYLDQGSRSAGEGSRNYVVFDESLVEILRKYGLAGLMAGGAAATASTEADAKQ